MRLVQVRLVHKVSKKALPQSNVVRSCHVEKEKNSWILYIEHEFGGRKNHAIFAKAVNEIMDGCLNDIGALGDILSCDSPSEIPGVLNDHDVTPDYSEESGLLGLLVPSVYHYLMIQNPRCDFDEGARVAYSEDEGGEKDWKNGENNEKSKKYTFAKILGRNNPVDREAAEFDFNAEYRIDFGNKTDYKIVSVLDIYNYSQDDLGNVVLDDDVEVNINVEKLSIRRALFWAKQLKSLPRRRKVLRRLFLHWFRCKDPKIAAEITTFIEMAVIRLEILSIEETSFLTNYSKRRGRRERTVFDSYSHWMSNESSEDHSSEDHSSEGYYSSRVYSFQAALEYVEPDSREAERWIKQSKADLVAAKMLHDRSHSLVCYLSQQCVEKVLKGALYAKCGIPRRELRTHDISRLASSVRRLEGAPVKVVDRSGVVANYYLATRYPDNQPKYRVPAEEYSEKQAKEALEVAEAVYTVLEKFVENSEY